MLPIWQNLSAPVAVSPRALESQSESARSIAE